ncbi:MAG TPA: cytochrome C oxidase subunit IV family protein [Thermoanaerobaculia bacterium]|nr:cytochrome C oxidase subunit IV family protein [Thermoanaerobaculia bacterium]
MADVHVSPVRTYATILIALLTLTGVTVWVAFLDLGALNDVVALGVALLKAGLVILFFMHVQYAGRLVKVVVVGGFFWLMLLFGLTVMDYVTRGDIVVDPAPVLDTAGID